MNAVLPPKPQQHFKKGGGEGKETNITHLSEPGPEKGLGGSGDIAHHKDTWRFGLRRPVLRGRSNFIVQYLIINFSAN